MLLGAHLSIAGGPHMALHRAARYGFDTVAIFVRNQRRWRAPPLTAAAAARFRRARRRLGIGPVIAHGSYLANLAGCPAVRKKSIAAVAEELDRCRRLGADYYVFHPGSPGRDGPEVGIARVAEALNRLIPAAGRRVKVLLETTAGAGRQLGGRFEELAEMLARLERRRRFGVCLDTCHVFAAGYDLGTPRACRRTMRRFDRIVGLDRLRVVHLNDSLADLGSRRDRHEHIGRGRIGLEGFANFVRDRRLADVPMILETPKGTTDDGRDWDRVNAETLRSLA
jgi:deoxyribonuclease-4